MLQKPNKEKRKFNNFIRYSSLGFEMAVIIILGTWGGYQLDKWLEHDFKTLTFIMTPLSVIVSIIYGIRNILRK